MRQNIRSAHSYPLSLAYYKIVFIIKDLDFINTHDDDERGYTPHVKSTQSVKVARLNDDETPY